MKGRTESVTAMVVEQCHEVSLPLAERLETISREELQRMEDEIGARALKAAVDDTRPAVRLRLAGRLVMAQPLDTRRFVRAMAAHLSFN